MRKRTIFVCLLACIFLLIGCGQKRPVIYAPDARIGVGESYDADDGVHALDAVDGDLTDQIKVTRGKLNTEKAGRYRIGYEVTNSRGYTARASRIITVSDQTPMFRNLLLLISVIGLLLLVLCFLLLYLRRRKKRICLCVAEQ